MVPTGTNFRLEYSFSLNKIEYSLRIFLFYFFLSANKIKTREGCFFATPPRPSLVTCACIVMEDQPCIQQSSGPRFSDDLVSSTIGPAPKWPDDSPRTRPRTLPGLVFFFPIPGCAWAVLFLIMTQLERFVHRLMSSSMHMRICDSRDACLTSEIVLPENSSYK